MKEILLKDLLEAGCHFGHRKEKWHPKAASFIYGAREGIHIIDLAKTKDGLGNAAEFIKNLGISGKTILFVATKRQAKTVVTEVAQKIKMPYLTLRWIGGFLTNWDEVKKNIEKLNRFRAEKRDGSWKKFPKHEIIKLEKHLHQLELVYGGVAELNALPDAIFIVDIKKEVASLKEAIRLGIPIVAIVDTNVDPKDVDYPIPANDDAVGSIQFIVNYIADAYQEGAVIREKGTEKEKLKTATLKSKQESVKEEKTAEKTEKTVQKELKPVKKTKSKQKKVQPSKS
jgi:small subunit ribosomal protein S2